MVRATGTRFDSRPTLEYFDRTLGRVLDTDRDFPDWTTAAGSRFPERIIQRLSMNADQGYGPRMA